MKRLLSVLALISFGAGCMPVPPTAVPSQQPTPATTAPVVKPTTTTTKPKTGTTSNNLQPSSGTVKPGPATITVNITSTGFSPQVVAVNAGDTVKWVNKDTGNHTVMSSASALWNSGNIPPGTSYARKFSAVGSYTYVDGAHPTIGGTVVVH
jgi:plastocyanin